MNLFDKIKEYTDRMLKGKTTIDDLMSDRVSDYQLIDETPCPVNIGRRVIWVGNLRIDNQFKFMKMYGEILGNLAAQNVTSDLLSDAGRLYELMHFQKWLHKDLMRLVKSCILHEQDYYYRELDMGGVLEVRLKKCTWRYFKKHITIQKLIEILGILYFYNIDAVKKNLSHLAKKLGVEAITATYIYSCLANCPGLIGKFSEPRSIRSHLLHEENSKEGDREYQKVKVNGK